MTHVHADIEQDLGNEAFLSMLAHELRNPLSPILNTIYVIEKINSSESQLVKNSAEILKRQLKCTVSVINNVLDILKIKKGEIELKKERVEICHLVRRAIEESGSALATRHHMVELHLPEKDIWVNGDEVRLKQVVSNIISNAAKFTEAGGKISITANYGAKTTTINIKDNGIGISQEALPEVFKLFSQISSSNRQLIQGGGLGVGLALSKELINLHNGTIEVHSDGTGKGSEFSIILPLEEVCEPCLLQDKTEVKYSNKKFDILVVDDHIDTAESLATVLKMYGHRVRVCHSGTAAIDVAKIFKPEVAFLDIGLPDMSGYQVAEEIKQNNPTISIIAISGYGQKIDQKRSNNAGFQEHLVKPVEVEKIQEVLSKMS